jgi:golgi phosphoprotein 3
MINLVEEYYILCLHEEKCKIIAAVEDTLRYGESAAALMELAIHQKIKVDEKRRVEVVDATPTGDDIVDEAMTTIQGEEKHRKISYWLEKLFVKPKKLTEHLNSHLVDKGIVRTEEESIYWVIPSQLHPEINASLRFAIKERLRVMVIADQKPSLRELALLGLADATGLSEQIFFKDERKLVRRHTYEMLVGEAMKDPTAQAIEDIQSTVAELMEEE